LYRPFINLCKKLAHQLVGIRFCVDEQDSLQVFSLLDSTRLKKLALYIPYDLKFDFELYHQEIIQTIRRCGPNLTHLKISGLRHFPIERNAEMELLEVITSHTGSLESLSVNFKDWDGVPAPNHDVNFADALSVCAQANSSTLRRLLFFSGIQPSKFLKWIVNPETEWNDFEEMEHIARTRFAVPLSGLRFGYDLSPWHIILDGGADNVKFENLLLRDLEPLHKRCFPRDAIGERAQSLTTMLSHLRQYLSKNVPDNVRWMREQLRDLVQDATVVYGGLSCRVVRVLESFIVLPDNLISDNTGDIKNYALELLKTWIASDKYIVKLLTAQFEDASIVVSTLFSDKAWIEQHGIDVNTRLTNGSPIVAAFFSNVAKAGPVIRHPDFDWSTKSKNGVLCLSYLLDPSNSKAFVLALGPSWREFVVNQPVLVMCGRVGMMQQLAKVVEFVEFFHWERLEKEARDVAFEIASVLWKDLIENESSVAKFTEHVKRLLRYFPGKEAIALGFINSTGWMPSSCSLGAEAAKDIIREQIRLSNF
jgi:hypothetical protein